MIGLPLETWVSIATLLGVGVTLATVTLASSRRTRTELKTDIARLDDRVDKLEAKLDGRIDKLDGRIDKLDGRIDKLDGRIDKLDDRVYALAIGLKPHLAPADADPAA